MSESAVDTSGPTLESILWAAMDRWSEEPALVDAEEFAAHISTAWEGLSPSEEFINRFFDGEPTAGRGDMAEAVVQATRERLQVYEFDLNRLEYVIIEDKDDLVVVSDFGQFSLPSDDQLSRAIEAAIIPDTKDPIGGGGEFDRGGGEPRAYLVRADGEMVAVDVAKIARALEQVRVRQVEAPAVDSPGMRMMPFSPGKRRVSEEREARILRQDARVSGFMPPPPPGRSGGGLDGAFAHAPPSGADQTLLVLLPDGSVARAAMGSATRWKDMVGDWTARAAALSLGASATALPVQGEVRFVVQSNQVVAVFSGGSSNMEAAAGSAGSLADVRSAGMIAARTMTANVRILGDDELAEAVANGAQFVSGLTARVTDPAGGSGTGFWVQPETLFAPTAQDRALVRTREPGTEGLDAPGMGGELGGGDQLSLSMLDEMGGQPLQLGQVTGDPWADWALQTGGKLNPTQLLLASRTRNLGSKLADGDGEDGVFFGHAATGSRRGALRMPGMPIMAFRAPDGSLVINRGDSSQVRLASVHRPADGGDFSEGQTQVNFRSPGRGPSLALLSGALPATAIQALSMALERTVSMGGYKMPTIRIDSGADAIGVGRLLDADLPADSPNRRGVRLMQAPTIVGSGQTARMLVSMPFPNAGEVNVGSDLSEALQAYLSAPALPVRGGSIGSGALGGFAGAMALRNADGQASSLEELHGTAREQAHGAYLTLQSLGVAGLMADKGANLAGLPRLLLRALETSGEWTPGPGAPMPGPLQDFVFSGPYDLPELVAMGDAPAGREAREAPRAPAPGEQEIVIPMPLWAQMGRGRLSATQQIMAAPDAPLGYAPPMGAYRLVTPMPVDLAGGAPAGTPGITRIKGPTALSLESGPMSSGAQARNLGGSFELARVPIDDGETVVGKRGRMRIGAPLDEAALASAVSRRRQQLASDSSGSGSSGLAPPGVDGGASAGGSGQLGGNLAGSSSNAETQAGIFSGSVGSAGSLGDSAPSGLLAAGRSGRPNLPGLTSVSMPDSAGIAGTFRDGTFTPLSGGSGAVGGRPMAGALNGALRLSGDVSSRALPSDGSLPSFSAGDAASGFSPGQGGRFSGAFASGSQPGGNLSSGDRISLNAQGAPQGSLVQGGQGGQVAGAADRLSAGSSGELAVSGLPAGAWSGHERSEPGYTPWVYGSSGSSRTSSEGGVDLSGLSKPSYPSLPTALRFRYVSAPLWWSSSMREEGGGSAEGTDDPESDSAAPSRALRSGLRAANSAASIWRSVFVGTGGRSDDVSGGMDHGWDQQAEQMGGLNTRLMIIGGAGGAAAGAASGALVGKGAESVYVAMDSQGRAGTTSEAMRSSAPGSVQMSIVAAIPPSPPSLESMGGGSQVQAHTRRHGHQGGGAHPSGSDHEDSKSAEHGVSHSKIEGSVDAVAQRIYHRIRKRIQNDRERFGG